MTFFLKNDRTLSVPTHYKIDDETSDASYHGSLGKVDLMLIYVYPDYRPDSCSDQHKYVRCVYVWSLDVGFRLNEDVKVFHFLMVW